ncbi:MAG: hypothetical protein ACRDTC_02330 [Pseudonocardiaceae bacterium]
MRVSRRVFLGGAGASAVGITLPPTAQAIAAAPRSVVSDDVNPLTHFIEMKKVFMDSDNLFGPARVINAVHQQLDLMQQLRQSWRGADRQRLLQVQTQYADLLGWLYQDSGDFPASRHWVDRSLEWSHLARDSQTAAFILARRSQLAADMGNPADAIDAAEAARATARPNTRIAAIAATFAGHGYALEGDADSVSRSYDQARELLLSGETDHESAYGLCFNEGYLDVYRARSLAALGRFLPAADIFQTAIEGLPEGYWRDTGVYLAWQARAYAGGREAEQAAELGLHALVVACETGSARIIVELAHLDDALAQWRAVPKIREFRAALTDVIPHQA